MAHAANRDLIGDLFNAFFDPEKYKRQYDPQAGQFIDPKTGVAGPDVGPYNRPGFWQRWMNPEAQKLIATNQAWTMSPQEAALKQNIDQQGAERRFRTLNPSMQKLIGTGSNLYGSFGDNPVTPAQAFNYGENVSGIDLNVPQAVAANKLAEQNAAKASNENKLRYEKQSGLMGIPETQAKEQFARSRYGGALAEGSLGNLPAQLDVDRLTLGNEAARQRSVVPLQRGLDITNLETVQPTLLGNQLDRALQDRYNLRNVEAPTQAAAAVRARTVLPKLIGNESLGADVQRLKMQGEEAALPLQNKTALDKANLEQQLMGSNLDQAQTLLGTQRFTNIGNNYKARFFGKDPVEAMSGGAYGELNDQGGVDVRQGLLPTKANLEALYNQDEMKAMGVGGQGVTYRTKDGKVVSGPPPRISAPLGSIGPQGSLLGNGVSLNLGGVGAGSAAVPALQGPSLGAPHGGTAMLTPAQEAQNQSLVDNYNSVINAVPAGRARDNVKRVAQSIISEAVLDEVGVQRNFIDNNMWTKSANSEYNKALRDPVLAQKIRNMPPHQMQRVFQKVIDGLVERGLIVNPNPIPR